MKSGSGDVLGQGRVIPVQSLNVKIKCTGQCLSGLAQKVCGCRSIGRDPGSVKQRNETELKIGLKLFHQTGSSLAGTAQHSSIKHGYILVS